MNLTERNKMLDKISVIVIMAIFVEFFLYAVDYCFTTRVDVITRMPIILNVLGIFFLLVSIIMFVTASKKENDKSLYKYIYAIEFLVLAFLCPFMTYWYYPKYFGLSTNFIHSISHHAILVVVLLYYIGRIIYTIITSYNNAGGTKFKKLNKKKVKN